ncbi:hypothetical protein ACFTAO_51180 [Paenibacillus rhizoplanae]
MMKVRSFRNTFFSAKSKPVSISFVFTIRRGVIDMFTVQTVVTAKDTGDRLSSKDGIQFSAEGAAAKADIVLHPEQAFQTIIGFWRRVH